METEKIVVEGPVYREEGGQVPNGTRIRIDVSARTFFLVHGIMFTYSGYSLYHSIKAIRKLNKELPIQ